MNLLEFTLAGAQNAACEPGSKIPWNDPDFSRRMLENHLSQEHDWASRRTSIIGRHTAWIAEQLRQRPSRVLDLGCGPGFYTQALAASGHQCVGVDFSPASIAHARKQADAAGLEIEYVLADLRGYAHKQPFDCILLTFGEFNVFTRQDALGILKNCAGLLAEDGFFLLEAQSYEAVRAGGEAPAAWQRNAGGLFSDAPHLCLQENSWNAAEATALSRYILSMPQALMSAATLLARKPTLMRNTTICSAPRASISSTCSMRRPGLSGITFKGNCRSLSQARATSETLYIANSPEKIWTTETRR